MRRRTTFLSGNLLDLDENQLTIADGRLRLRDLKGAREERVTLGVDELPQELRQVFHESHELHLRWQSEAPYSSTVPLVSRLSPGLHVFYTPLRDHSSELICPLLHKLFTKEMKCHHPDDTFSRPSMVSSRFAAAASMQYYSILPRLTQFVKHLQHKACDPSDYACIQPTALLDAVDSLDIDYDSISHAVTINAFWSKPPSIMYDLDEDTAVQNAWTLSIAAQKGSTAEVGVLHSSAPADRHDVQLEGFLINLGEDIHPKATLFQFPSRHHAMPSGQVTQGFTASFDRPSGLHPTLRISFPGTTAPEPPSSRPDGSMCALHTYLTLPSASFTDKYQLSTSDHLFLSSHNIRALRSVSGATDLEAPDYAVKAWGSNVLLELATPDDAAASQAGKTWDVTIPLHLRYLAPNTAAQTNTSIPWPVVFWACTAEEGTKFPVNPFDRVNIGYDGLFGPRTMFYHLIPSSKTDMIERLPIPVLGSRVLGNSTIETVTVVSVLCGFLWVSLKLLPGLLRQISRRGVSPATRKQQ